MHIPCDVAVLTLNVYNSGQTSYLLSLDVNSKLGPVMLASLLINVLAISRKALEKTWGINNSLFKIIFLKWLLSVQSLRYVRLFAPPWTAAHQASLSITNSQSLLKLISIESVMPSTRLILCRPLLLLPFGSFPMRQLFTSGGQSIGVSASASVLAMNIQDWSPLGWTGRISLQSKGLSWVFSNTTFQKHQFFSAQLSLYPNSHIHANKENDWFSWETKKEKS